jgi:hypothetical protein
VLAFSEAMSRRPVTLSSYSEKRLCNYKIISEWL